MIFFLGILKLLYLRIHFTVKRSPNFERAETLSRINSVRYSNIKYDAIQIQIKERFPLYDAPLFEKCLPVLTVLF